MANQKTVKGHGRGSPSSWKDPLEGTDSLRGPKGNPKKLPDHEIVEKRLDLHMQQNRGQNQSGFRSADYVHDGDF